MKSFFSLILFAGLSGFCQAQNAYELAEKLHAPEALKKDVDFVRKQLERDHPNLYRYIEKDQLRKKFDSLKATLYRPLKSSDFNGKLLTVLSAIGDGHLLSYPDVSKFSKEDVAKYTGKNPPIWQFEYRIFSRRLYISKNLSKDTSLVRGTEILSIEGIPAAKLIDTLARAVPSDGYNQTFKYFMLNFQLPSVYRSVYGWKDTLHMQVMQNSRTRSVTPATYQTSASANQPSAIKPDEELKFLGPDSIAFLKVRSFTGSSDALNNYRRFFSSIRRHGSKVLVLDLRGNTGGEYLRAANLYSYFIDSPAYFITRPDQLIKGVLLPPFRQIRKQQIDWYKQYHFMSAIRPDSDSFKGRVYVLIDGGSFSSSSAIAANLQGMKNVTFIGQETGGGRNGWTAGQFEQFILPESKLTLRFGIIPFEFTRQDDLKGRGVMPDVPITYTIDDYLSEKDLEMEWVLKDIQKNKTP